MRGDLLVERLGDLAEIDDRLRHGDPEAHNLVVQVLASMSAADVDREGRAATKLLRWLPASERATVNDAHHETVDLRSAATSAMAGVGRH